MRKNKETIILAKIRRQIRNAIQWSKVDDGYAHFYTTRNYKYATKLQSPVTGNYPYYNKTTQAIEDIAKRILKIVREKDGK